LGYVGGALGLSSKAEERTKCRTAVQGDKCYKAAHWAQTDGIFAHPEWYPGLSHHAGVAQFQAFVHSYSANHECPHAPCEDDVEAARRNEKEALRRAKEARAAAKRLPPPMPVVSAAPALVAPAQDYIRQPVHSVLPNQVVGDPHRVYRWNISCTPPLVPVPEPVVDGRSDHEVMTCGCTPPLVLSKQGLNSVCTHPASMSKMTFYVYRAQSDDDYAPENVNVADLAGLMWYLHNEVVPSTPRKFAVTRILRYKITMQNTEEFYHRFPKQFGPFVAFDSGRCTAPHCNGIWKDYGFVIGCQNLDRYVVNVARDYVPPADDTTRGIIVRQLKDEEERVDREKASKASGGSEHQHGDHATTERTTTQTRTTTTWTTTTWTTTTQTHIHDGFHSGIWYSLPGTCPDKPVGEKSEECVRHFPGGRCSSVDGSKSCTYDIEPAGEISLNELSGIPEGLSYDEWWKNSACWAALANGEQVGPCTRKEYDPMIDKGFGTDFWNGKHIVEQGARRLNRIRQLFLEKYPHLPVDMSEPECL